MHQTRAFVVQSARVACVTRVVRVAHTQTYQRLPMTVKGLCTCNFLATLPEWHVRPEWPHAIVRVGLCGPIGTRNRNMCSQNTFAPDNFGTVPEWHVWPKRHTHRIVATELLVRALANSKISAACCSGTEPEWHV